MVIKVNNLQKEFRVKQRRDGFKGSVQDLLAPNYRRVEAVKGINFEVQSGEMLAFIGPNGAGKSTTIKMLTGILTPTSGGIRVMGFNPSRERRKLSRHIGTVYGQKSQLWFHLPAIDTFRLFAKIYEVDHQSFKGQLDRLTEILDLEKYLTIPARRLSLGQRMKCEIAASLLHRPKLLFLDEPTIGLDVVAKQQIRDALLEMNKKDGTTVILTSHDTGDMEAICERAIVINNGAVMFDERIGLLKKRYLTYKQLDIQFMCPVEELILPNGTEVQYQDAYSLRLRVDSGAHVLPELMRMLGDRYPIADITIREPLMEEVIREMYMAQVDSQMADGGDCVAADSR